LPYSILRMIPFPRNSLLLAPMVGITNRAFRTLLSEIGPPDYAFTEMASAEAFVSRAQYEECYTDTQPSPERTSVQFYARSAEALAAACAAILERDATLIPAGIDINFGCSAPHIRRSGGGSAWSSNPKGAANLVAAARAAWPGRLSAKLRMGPDDDYDRFLAFCSGLAEAGLDFLTVHPRTDGQKYKRSPRYEYIGRLARDLALPIIGNGDLSDADTLRSLMTLQKPYAAMIGREAVRRPWVFGLLRAQLSGGGGIENQDRLGIGLRFLDLVESELPLPWRMESSRRFFSYYCDTLSFAHHIKYKVINSPDLQGMRDTLIDYFEEVPGDRILLPA